MKEYYWNDEGHCTNDDTMNYKADGVLAAYSVAKNKHGWKHTYSIESPSVTICTPIGWNDEEVSATKSQAVELAKFELMQALSTSNYNGRFDGVLMAMGQVPAPKIETSNEPQLSLF
jgi:hypothetical protein